MNIKIVCKKCGENIKDFSIFVQDFSFRKDFLVNPAKNNINPCFIEYDREYYSGTVGYLIYSCGCGETEMGAEDYPELHKFIREKVFYGQKELEEFSSGLKSFSIGNLDFIIEK